METHRLYLTNTYNVHVAFIKYNEVIYKAAAPAISKVSELAEASGNPHAKIISTTPNNIDKPEGAFCKKLIDSSCTFIEDMYGWTRDEIKEYIKDNSSTDFLYIKYTWKQLGLTDEWYERECRALDNDWLIINREINLVWTKASDNSVFKEDVLNAIFQALRTPIGTFPVEFVKSITDGNSGKKVNKLSKFFITLYEELCPNKTYFIGVDTAGGLDRDNSSFIITDPVRDCKPVGVFKNNTINTSYYSTLLLTLIKKHLPNSILFIENNSYGKGVIDNIIDFIPKNIYYQYNVQDKDKTKSNPKLATNSITWGINTNPQTRDVMMDVLKETVNDTPELMCIEELYDDLKALVYDKNGRIDHEPNLHDDTLMAYIMVKYTMHYGNNISKFLRDIKDPEKGMQRLRQITNSQGNIVDDPVYNKGTQVDLSEILNLVSAGMDPAEALITIAKRAGEGKKSVDAKLINTLLEGRRK